MIRRVKNLLLLVLGVLGFYPVMIVFLLLGLLRYIRTGKHAGYYISIYFDWIINITDKIDKG